MNVLASEGILATTEGEPSHPREIPGASFSPSQIQRGDHAIGKIPPLISVKACPFVSKELIQSARGVRQV